MKYGVVMVAVVLPTVLLAPGSLYGKEMKQTPASDVTVQRAEKQQVSEPSGPKLDTDYENSRGSNEALAQQDSIWRVSQKSIFNSLISAILGGIAGTLATCLVLWFIFCRQAELERLGNLMDFYFHEYLSADIKKAREVIKEAPYRNHIINTLQRDQAADTISKAMQRIGILAYQGVIPLSFVLTMNGLQIASDWVWIKPIVDKTRSGNPDWETELPYTRRHAEWLALISYMWFMRGGYKDNPPELMADLRKLPSIYEKGVLQREQILFESKSDWLYVDGGTTNLRHHIVNEFSGPIPPFFPLFLTYWRETRLDVCSGESESSPVVERGD